MSHKQLSWTRSLFLVGAFVASQISWSRKTIFLGVLLLLPAVIAVITRSEAPRGAIDEYLAAILPTFTIGVVQLICLFNGAGLMRGSMEDRTLAFLLTRPMSRARIALGHYAGLIAFVVPLALISAGAGFLVCRAGLPSGVFSPETDGPASAEALTRLLIVTGTAAVFYSALYTLFGLLSKHSTLIGLVFIVVVDALLGSLPGTPRTLSHMAYFEALLQPFYLSRATVSELAEPIAPLTAGVILGAMLVGIMTGIVALARGKDMVPFDKAQ